MAIIPNDEQFVGIDSSVDMKERKSSRVNEKTEVYTFQDFKDSLVSADLAPITVDGNSVSIAKDPTATTQDTVVIQSSDTNAGIAIVPNGTGAITAQVPDGTTAGGNERGDYSVDLQRVRTSRFQVSEGAYSGILSGQNNEIQIDATHGVIAGGLDNFVGIEGLESYGFIGGGRYNTVNAPYASVVGGQNNEAIFAHSTVLGGLNNVSSGRYSVSGGNNSTASADNSVAIGSDAVANLQNSVALGNQVTSLYTDGTTVKNFAIANYANLNYANDTAAASGGVPLGGVYHTSGTLKIRIT